jgi:hypothetical protein
MIKIELNHVWGFLWAINAARLSRDYRPAMDVSVGWSSSNTLSPEDLALADKLIRRGDDHAKFLRCITVYLTIAAPMYWWREFDAYRVGVTSQSQSTLGVIHNRAWEQRDFTLPISEEKLADINGLPLGTTSMTMRTLTNQQLVARCPEGRLQARAICTNYQTLRRMFQARHNHELEEWRDFCSFLKMLPNSQWITD